MARLSFNDEDWMYRKLLISTVDPHRLKRHDTGVYVPFAILGASLAILSIILGLLQFNIGFQVTLITTIATSLIYGLHRYAVSIEAVDLRFMAISLEYTTTLYGLPVVLIILFFGRFLISPIVEVGFSFLEFPFNTILYFIIITLFCLALCLIFSKTLQGFIIFRLQKIWSEIRAILPSDEIKHTKESEIPIGIRIGKVGEKNVFGTFGVAMVLAVGSTLYSFWFYLMDKSPQFIEIEWVHFTFIPGIILLMYIALDFGRIVGLTHANNQFSSDNLEYYVDENGIFVFKPSESSLDALRRIISGKSGLLSFKREKENESDSKK